MTDQTIAALSSFSSSGGWHPSGTMVPLRQLSLNVVNDAADTEAKEINGGALATMTIIKAAGRTYPAWLNRVAWCVLSIIPIGLVLVLLGISVVGLALMGGGFLGLWIFGDLAVRLGRNKEQIGYIVGSSRIS